MSSVFVVDQQRKPLDPVHPGRARYLLTAGHAAVLRRYPFTIIPKSRGGSDRLFNLTLACHDCNQAKGNQTAEEFGHPEVSQQAKAPLKDAAAVNATRWSLYQRLASAGLPIEAGSGGRTKWNRKKQGFPKTHWLDAACVGASTPNSLTVQGSIPLLITAI